MDPTELHPRQEVPQRAILLIAAGPDCEQLVLRAARRSMLPVRLECARGQRESLVALGRLPNEALLLLDLDGEWCPLDELRRLRARLCLAPAIALSETLSEELMAGAYRAGANGFVQKPANSLGFLDAIEELLRYWITTNASPANYDDELIEIHTLDD
jgi:DNA-binding NarL/FixJ family response regulator